MKARRVLVAGAGGLGSVFGGFLRRAGHDVTLLGRPAHLEAIRRGGLRIEGIFGEAEVSGFGLATSGRETGGGFDLVIVAVKSYDTVAIAREVAGTLSETGSVLTVQNGLVHLEALAEVFERDRLLAAPVLIGAELPAPGRVRVTVYAKPVKIGARWGTGASAELWSEILNEAGIPAEPTDRLLGFLW
ncbi:MAG: ketopantoate reductase family protein, partial [Candidatus Binatia bacterium]